MTANESVILTWSCESCDDIDYCQSEDITCPKCLAEMQLADFARSVAKLLAESIRHVPAKSRSELAEYVRDGIDNALHDIGGRINGDTFMALAGFAKEA